uniref:SUZ domain-containing protein 1-like n=1 Tax=Ciona intestinalis TaxID=7719 RepID=F6SD42_CIOIN|nr:SUZ domain-containing protein 1-like [Ciona intestinalis]|eukprot:XP_002119900.1 SUZ domain-containing protein 1-like [Ciona intestinalis]
MADDSIWDSWEDFADSGDIDKHVENGLNINGTDYANYDEKLKPNKKKTDGRNDDSEGRNSLSPQPGFRILARPAVVHEDDQNRTAYTPQLKILRRPGKSSEQQRYEDEQRRLAAQQPVKTLAQREAAYAAARQRIMGNEKNKSGNETHAKSGGTAQENRSSSRPEHLRRFSKSKNHQNGSTTEVRRQPKGAQNSKGFKNNR